MALGGTAAANADPEGIARGSRKPSFVVIYGGNNYEKSSMNREHWDRRWKGSEIVSWLRSWWPTQRERDGEYYALPTTSTGSFEDFGSSSKSGLESPIMPIAAENRSHKSSHNEPVSPPSLAQYMNSTDIVPSSANITSPTRIRLLCRLHRHRSQCRMDASTTYSIVK